MMRSERSFSKGKRLEGVIARNEVTKQSPPLTAIAPWRLLRFARNDRSRGSVGLILNVHLNGYLLKITNQEVSDYGTP
jgi:hypothetical protein